MAQGKGLLKLLSNIWMSFVKKYVCFILLEKTIRGGYKKAILSPSWERNNHQTSTAMDWVSLVRHASLDILKGSSQLLISEINSSEGKKNFSVLIGYR